MIANRKEGISIQVSLAVAAIDDFSGRPVTRSQLHVWIDGERPPVVKEGGYFLFTDLKNTHPVIHLEGPMFYRQDIIFDTHKWMQYKGKVLKVRMIPNRSYPIPRHTTCIQGHAAPGSTVLAYNTGLKEPLKLLYPYTAGQEDICIFHPDDMDLEGKRFYIRGKDGTSQEVFKIAGRIQAGEQEKNRYGLALPLMHAYKKIGTAIYPVYVSKADQAGEFYLPAAGIHTETAVFEFWLEGKEQGRRKIQLQAGKVNQLEMER